MYRKEDMDQMSKMGYFTKMNGKERGQYDEMQGKFDKSRKEEDEKWDEFRKDFKDMGDYDKMDKGGKQQFMKQFDNMRGMQDKQNYKDRDQDNMMKQKL